MTTYLAFDLALCRRWKFAWDPNHDGVLNYRELTSLLHFVFDLPAKAVMSLVDSQPHLRRFFESDCHTATGLGGGVFSLVVWLMLYGLVAQIAGDFHDARRKNGTPGKQLARPAVSQWRTQASRRVATPQARHKDGV